LALKWAHTLPVEEYLDLLFFFQRKLLLPLHGKYLQGRDVMMHGQRLLFAMLLLVLPSQAQSNQALPPNVPDVAGNLIPMQDTNSILVRPRAIVPTGQTLYRWSVAAVLAGSAADAASS